MSFNISSLSEDELKEFDKPEDASPGSVQLDETPENTEENNSEPINLSANKAVPTTEVGVYEPEPGDAEEQEEEQDNELSEDEDSEERGTQTSKKGSSEKQLDYTAYYKLLVSKGEWIEVTDDKGNPLDDIELDDETFQELAIKQAEWKADLILKERESEYGTQYQELVQYLKNGGRLEDIARYNNQIFDVEQLDPSNSEQAEEILKAHYEALGFSEKRIKVSIDSLKDQGEDILIETANESKQALLEAIQEEKEEELQRQELIKRRNEDAKMRFTRSLKEQIHTDGISDREKKELEKFYFDYRTPIPGGVASDFYIKYQEIQSDPSKFYKLVKFIKNIDGFQESDKADKKAVKNTFNLLRTGETISKKSTEYPDNKKSASNKKPPTTFKKLFS